MSPSDPAVAALPASRAKPLPARLPPAVPALVPARMVAEALYCERLMYLEWAQREFADNAFTVEGRLVHKRADTPGGALPPKPSGASDDTAAPAAEERPYQARSVWLSSETLHLTGKIDIVEGESDGRVVPIEYKRGKAPDVPGGVYPPQRAQVCAQALLLREAGYQCDEGALYFAGSKLRVTVPITDELIAMTLEAVRRARELASIGTLPPPLDGSPKCNGCSLTLICLPDETTLLRRLEHQPEPTTAPEVDAAAEDDEEVEPRRLFPARDDAVPLYVKAQGGRVGLSGERLKVWTKDASEEVRLSNTSQVSLFGNIQLTTQAARALIERDVPILYFSMGGWFWGRTIGMDSKNVDLRIAQYEATTSVETSLGLARGFIVAKIRNCRTMLRRNLPDPAPELLSELDRLARKVASAASTETLLGLEGTAAKLYFQAFSGMLRDPSGVGQSFELDGRNRRPPRDPVNAMLSFAYALLTKDVTIALTAVGLDPLLGFYHRPHFGRPGLALDMMEEMRPLIADSVVITAVNTGVIGPYDFDRVGDRCNLKDSARRAFILAYERRMDQLVTHPVFGYRVSYRRVLEVQARLLSRVLLGELTTLPPFRTR
ncbi:MAG: CRISPR-associated endonuclease Cas1 [Polyangiaceae bacterium]|nr:CRISPR-associated endonuclease Cas1 [Polyangiaceae bacterium]